MARISLGRIVSGFLSAEKVNTILESIETALDRTVFRDGAVPNVMDADLDLGGHALLNVGSSPSQADSIPTFGQVTDYIDARAEGLVSQRVETVIATAAQTLVEFTEISYSLSSNNLAVYVNGVRQFTPADYVETSTTSITFGAGLNASDEVVGVTNDYLATVSLPTHQHTWAQITGTPEYTTRWPTWNEVTGKPSTFAPAAHNQDAATITTGRLADARRGVYVQAAEPTGLGAGDVGALWFWG